MSDAGEAILRRETAGAGLPTIERLVIAWRVDHRMRHRIEMAEHPSIVLVCARSPEDVADVNEPRDVVRVQFSHDEIEPRLLPGVVGRVAENGEGERAGRIGLRPFKIARDDQECGERNDPKSPFIGRRQKSIHGEIGRKRRP